MFKILITNKFTAKHLKTITMIAWAIIINFLLIIKTRLINLETNRKNKK